MEATSGPPERRIAEIHFGCEDALKNLCERTADSHLDWILKDPDLKRRVQNELERYQLWASNVGAGHRTYKLSLDYRLEDTPFYQESVIRVLEIVHRHVRLAVELLDSPSNAAGSGDEVAAGSSVQVGSQLVTSRNAGGLSEVSNDEKHELRPSQEESFLLLVRSVEETITTLYQMQIRKPAPIERLENDLLADLKFYQHFDILHVRNKFRALDERVATSLGNMISRRRLLLKYREQHQKNLRDRRTNIPSEKRINTNAVTTRAPSLAIGDGKAATRLEPAADALTESSSQLQSVATKLKPSPMDQVDRQASLQPPQNKGDDVESILSDQISAFTKVTPTMVPLRPKENGIPKKSFNCPYCRLPKYILDDKAWRKHVLADLMPYLCTFPGCELLDQPFESRSAWWSHEMQHHRVDYYCNQKPHHPYQKLEDFQKHMTSSHNLSISDTIAMIDLFRLPSQATEASCNICGHVSKRDQLKAHVSRHLEQLALFAIPRADYIDEVDIEDTNGKESVRVHRINQSSQASPVLENLAIQSRLEESQEDESDYSLNSIVAPKQDPAWDETTGEFTDARGDQPAFRAGQQPNEVSSYDEVIEDATKPMDDKTGPAYSITNALRFPNMFSHESQIPEAYHQTFTHIFDRTINFSDWLKFGKDFFWVSGKPGSGKSTLMKFIVQDIRTKSNLLDWASTHKVLIASYFAQPRGTLLQRSEEGLFRSILYQLLTASPAVDTAVQRNISDRLTASLPQFITEELVQAIDDIGKQANVCIFIDGLDQFETSSPVLIIHLQQLTQNDQIKICVSSRPWILFEDAFGGGPHLRLEELTYDDIKNYADSMLRQSRYLVNLQDSERTFADLSTRITQKAQGVFLWVYLVVRSLLEGITNGDGWLDLERRLDQLPPELGELFQAMLSRIDPAYRTEAAYYFKLALKDLNLPVEAYEEPEVEDLDSVIQRTGLASLSIEEQTYRRERMRRRIASRCQGLLEVVEDDDGTFLTSKVQFFHRTVRDFFYADEMQKWFGAAYPTGFNAVERICKRMIGVIKTLPVQDRSKLALSIKASTDIFMKSLHKLVSTAETTQKLCTLMINNLDYLNGIHATNSLGLEMHWTNIWVPRHDVSEEYGHKDLLAVLIEGRIDFLNYSGLDIDVSEKIEGKRGRPHLDYVLRPEDNKQEDWVISTWILQQILLYGANPNQKYLGSTVWILFLSACYHMSDGGLLYDSLRVNQCEAIEMLLESGAYPFVTNLPRRGGVEGSGPAETVVEDTMDIFKVIAPPQQLESLDNVLQKVRTRFST